MSVLKHMRACLFCGSLWGKTDLICRVCTIRLGRIVENCNERPRGYPFRVRSLFSWKKSEENTWKSKLLLSLKGGGYNETQETLARWFLLKRKVERTSCEIVPAPARSEGSKDHAYCWAKALSRLSGYKNRPLLSRVDMSEQKAKKLEERSRSRMSLNGYPLVEKGVVFVDDLIASGSTAKAAYEALGKPENFEVWTIAHRPKLADKYVV